MRGQQATDGATRVSANGYHYTKVEGKWRLTHHLVAEKKLGRALREGERVVFGEAGKSDLSPANVTVVPAGKGSTRRRIAQIEARIEELQAELATLQKEA